MSPDYYIEQPEPITEIETAANRLTLISQLLADSEKLADKDLGRNVLTRTLDTVFALERKYLLPLHWLVAAVTSVILFLYVRLVALTSRLITTGSQEWPDVPTPSVLALWHHDAPSLLVAFAKRRPRTRMVIMISLDPRGDTLALLCRLVGLGVVRGDSHERGWDALLQLAHELMNGACVILTADGGGPARIAKVGAVALASSVGVPLIPVAANCRPAIEERHKWDAARNPLPFGSLFVLLGLARRFEPFEERSSIEEARSWLEATLTLASFDTAAAMRTGAFGK
jgi:lysophospholipid acyltransferase (LPLAT)-like uncharacterized protein